MAEFTIDLAKLGSFAGADDGQESALTMTKRKVSVIGSDDDGPADFTLNMERWMKGTQQWQKMGDRVSLQGMQSSVEDGNGLGDESLFAPLSTSTPALDRSRRASVEDEVEEEQAKPMTPPLTRHNTQTLQDRAAEEVFSQISALQAEVERLRLEAEAHQAEKARLEQDRIQLENDNGDLEHDLQEARLSITGVQEKARANAASLQTALREVKSQLASEGKRADEGWQAAERAARAVEDIEKEKAQADEKAQGEDEEKRRGNLSNVASLRTKFEPLAQELESVKAEAEAAKQRADAKVTTLEAKLRGAVDDGANLREQAEADQQSADCEIKRLRLELHKCQDELLNHQKSSDVRERELASTIEGLRRELQASHESNANVTVLRMELESAQEQLSETRRILETVETENDRLTHSDDRHKQDVAAQNASLEDARRQLEEKGKEAQEARSTIERLYTDIEEMKAEKDAGMSDEETREHQLAHLKKQHKSELGDMEEKQKHEIKALKATLIRAGEGMKKREERIALLHRGELASVKQQLEDQKKQFTAKQSKLPADLKIDATADTITELRSAIRVLSIKLKSAQADLSQTQQNFAAARQEAVDVRQSNEAVNAELEARFADACEAREAEWRRRVELLLREREKMGRALLYGWGREEVGPVEGKHAGEKARQGYRYKYVR